MLKHRVEVAAAAQGASLLAVASATATAARSDVGMAIESPWVAEVPLEVEALLPVNQDGAPAAVAAVNAAPVVAGAPVEPLAPTTAVVVAIVVLAMSSRGTSMVQQQCHHQHASEKSKTHWTLSLMVMCLACS